MKVTRIAKIAGLSFIGFCAAAALADKVNLNPLASQAAGFIGALAGSIVARRRTKADPEGAARPDVNPVK